MEVSRLSHYIDRIVTADQEGVVLTLMPMGAVLAETQGAGTWRQEVNRNIYRTRDGMIINNDGLDDKAVSSRQSLDTEDQLD